MSKFNDLKFLMHDPTSPKKKINKYGVNTKKYTILACCSPKFQHIYNNYKLQNQEEKVKPDIHLLLSEHRVEKLKTLTEVEILKDEIVDEIRKFKELQTIILPDRLSQKTSEISTKNLVPKIKEKRQSLLITFKNFKKKHKLPAIKGQRRIIIDTTFLNADKMLYEDEKFGENYKKQLIKKRNEKIRKNTLRQIELNSQINNNLANNTSTNSIMNNTVLRSTMDNMNTKIHFLSNEIENDLFNLKKTYSTNFNNFNTQYENWKNANEFKYPELRPEYVKNNQKLK
jgi:hypothetical protein